MTPRRASLVLMSVAVLVAACSGGGGSTAAPSAPPESPAASASAAVTRVEVTLTDAGCHVAGHYAGGMKAAITVTG